MVYMMVFISTAALYTQAQNSPQDFLNPHNAARSEVGVKPIEWDDQLASVANDWANQNKGSCQLHHSDHHDLGENLFWGGGSGWTAAQAVGDWVSEKQYWHPDSLTCDAGEECGHYTQVIWRGASKVGCATITCNTGDTWIGCNYNVDFYK